MEGDLSRFHAERDDWQATFTSGNLPIPHKPHSPMTGLCRYDDCPYVPPIARAFGLDDATRYKALGHVERWLLYDAIPAFGLAAQNGTRDATLVLLAASPDAEIGSPYGPRSARRALKRWLPPEPHWYLHAEPGSTVEHGSGRVASGMHYQHLVIATSGLVGRAHADMLARLDRKSSGSHGTRRRCWPQFPRPAEALFAQEVPRILDEVLGDLSVRPRAEAADGTADAALRLSRLGYEVRYSVVTLPRPPTAEFPHVELLPRQGHPPLGTHDHPEA